MKEIRIGIVSVINNRTIGGSTFFKKVKLVNIKDALGDILIWGRN